MGWRVQFGRYSRGLSERLSCARRESEPETASFMDRVWHGGSPDHRESQSARVDEKQGPEGNRDRNARRAHLDGLATESGGVYATVVPVENHIFRDYGTFTESRFSDGTYFTAAVRS